MRKRKYDYNKILNKFKNGESCKEIAAFYNTDHRTIRKILKTFKIEFLSNRKYFFNESYFEKIDSEEKAYFLGLIYADGCNTGEGLKIGLQLKDSYILDKLAKKLNYHGLPNITSNKKLPNNFYSVYYFYSKKLSKDLINLGVLRRKTYFLEFPNTEIIPEEYQSHFIRGYFDGDGCIGKSLSTRTINQHYITFVGLDTFLESIMNIINKYYAENKGSISYKKNHYKHTKYLTYSGNNIVYKIYNYLYKNCGDLYLTRKEEKFDKIELKIKK